MWAVNNQEIIMKYVLLTLLITGAVSAQERVSLVIDGDTAAICHQLIDQVTLSAKDPNFVESATKLDIAKKDIEKAIEASKEKKGHSLKIP